MKYSTYPWSQDSDRFGLVGLIWTFPPMTNPPDLSSTMGSFLPWAQAPVLTAATAKAMAPVDSASEVVFTIRFMKSPPNETLFLFRRRTFSQAVLVKRGCTRAAGPNYNDPAHSGTILLEPAEIPWAMQLGDEFSSSLPAGVVARVGMHAIARAARDRRAELQAS
jgi:hypothetical protein